MDIIKNTNLRASSTNVFPGTANNCGFNFVCHNPSLSLYLCLHLSYLAVIPLSQLLELHTDALIEAKCTVWSVNSSVENKNPLGCGTPLELRLGILFQSFHRMLLHDFNSRMERRKVILIQIWNAAISPHLCNNSYYYLILLQFIILQPAAYPHPHCSYCIQFYF